MKLNETQIDSVSTCLINGLKRNNKENRKLYAIRAKDEHKYIRALCKKALETISTKLNDKQLYLLAIYLSERVKKKCESYVQGTLSNIRRYVEMCNNLLIERNIQTKNENTLMNKENSNNCSRKTANDTDIQLLVFCLTTFNPRIQLSCDDNNTNFDALNELIRYCDEQAIE
ncbi:hypothetical protein RFI_31790 [Reticulomyxa filosa]|uniref:Uncharacterized protein n=1 Tax=Reticulomyxa filosa TaxID=46433 RepID=X6LWT3_RETFI|nr:hypothetical protein RFI_31790 [Reticulomyxa filosa]|eukprot:ETO05607.1 hypothetical protein RFI_31790 [Reticulomyxa filosa]